MAQILSADKDTITGIKLEAFRKGQPFPLPADAIVGSSDPSILTASHAGSDVELARAPSPGGGDVFITATAGGLTASLSVTVEAAAPDTLVFNESGAVTA